MLTWWNFGSSRLKFKLAERPQNYLLLKIILLSSGLLNRLAGMMEEMSKSQIPSAAVCERRPSFCEELTDDIDMCLS